MRKDNPIGFFDSGVGGLSVYSRFRRLLPCENTLYFGDLKNMPYGNKTKPELVSFARRILDFFANQQVKSVVIACNTSSAVAYDEIRDDYDFKIYPIIQSCAEVVASMGFKRVGVFATAATINSDAYKTELLKHNDKLVVIQEACPNWTSIVESGQIESAASAKDIECHISNIMLNKPEKIILGCTHYPFLLKVLSKYLSSDMFIDPAEIFTEYIKKDLKTSNMINEELKAGTEKFYVSSNPAEFVKNAKIFYRVEKTPIVV